MINISHIPPLRIPNNFSLNNLTPETLSCLHEAFIKIETISNHLYDKGYTPLEKYQITEKMKAKATKDLKIKEWENKGWIKPLSEIFKDYS